MKTLNLEQLGVQEMDAVEMKETNGGIAGIIIAGLIVLFILLSTEDAK